MDPTPKRVAVVGSGLAGLAAAYFLQQGGHTVELFERGGSAGMDLASVDVDGQRIDVPLRVFTPSYYPCLQALYTHLRIATTAADYSLAFSTADGSALWSYTNLTLGDFQVPIPDSVAGHRLAIARDWARLLFASASAVRTPHSLRPGGPLDVPAAEYLDRHRYGEQFTASVLFPFLASIFTCSVRAAAQYPANAVLHFVAKVAFGARLRRVHGGVSEVCRRLLRTPATVHYNSPVARITPDLHVVLADGREPQFDAVVVATPADTAACLVADVAPALARALALIEYEDACVVTHRDAAVMPLRPADWRGVNIAGKGDRAMASHWLHYVDNSQHVHHKDHLFQTVDPSPPVDSQKVVAAAGFHRSLLTVQSQRAVNDIHRMQGQRRVWVVGAYAAPGVPLLEGCVRSAADVAEGLGAPAPFDMPPQQRKRRRKGKNSKILEYRVGLAPDMVRGESVHAFFEHDAFVFDFTADSGGFCAKARTFAAWLAFVAMLPILNAASSLLKAIVGPSAAHHIQIAILDAALYIVCTIAAKLLATKKK